MDFVEDYFPVWFNLLNCVVIFLITVMIAFSLRKVVVIKKQILNLWLWSVFLTTLMWLIRASVVSGINMHLSGSMLMALMFGWRISILGMILVISISGFFNHTPFINYGTAIVLNGVLPVSISYGLFLLCEARLPRHFFIYIFISSFFGTWLSVIATGTFIASCLYWFEVFSWKLLSNDFLPFYYLLGFSEAFTTTALITLFVVYKPQWVYSFRDKLYLEGK